MSRTCEGLRRVDRRERELLRVCASMEKRGALCLGAGTMCSSILYYSYEGLCNRAGAMSSCWDASRYQHHPNIAENCGYGNHSVSLLSTALTSKSIVLSLLSYGSGIVGASVGNTAAAGHWVVHWCCTPIPMTTYAHHRTCLYHHVLSYAYRHIDACLPP